MLVIVALTQTVQRVSRRFYFDRLQERVRQYIIKCDRCQTAKRARSHAIPLMNGPLPKGPMDIIAIDFVTGLPATRLGHTAALVVVDLFSRFAWFLPTKFRDGDVVLDELHDQVFVRFGWPNAILSDRAPEFISGPLRKYEKANHIRHLRTSGYHPRANGAAERLVGTFSELLRLCCKDNPSTWPVLTPVLAYAYNTAWHSSLSVTPFRIMFGRDPNELDGFPSALDPRDMQGEADLVAELQWRQYLMHQMVYRSLNKLRQQRNLLNESLHYPSFEEGDLVYISRRPRVYLRRLSARRLGPYRIARVVNDVTYLVEALPESPLQFAQNESRLFHVMHLSPYHGTLPADEPEEVQANEPPLPSASHERPRASEPGDAMDESSGLPASQPQPLSQRRSGNTVMDVSMEDSRPVLVDHAPSLDDIDLLDSSSADISSSVAPAPTH